MVLMLMISIVRAPFREFVILENSEIWKALLQNMARLPVKPGVHYLTPGRGRSTKGYKQDSQPESFRSSSPMLRAMISFMISELPA
jgi:hypothetical protein